MTHAAVLRSFPAAWVILGALVIAVCAPLRGLAQAEENEKPAATSPAQPPAATASQPLDLAQATRKLEVRTSDIGRRDTLLFYTFEPQRIIVKLRIGNKDTTFPMSGAIVVFSPDTNPKGLEKWINNQHSDALFPLVPQPVAEHRIPAPVVRVTEQKLIDREKLGLHEYDNYDVQFVLKG